MGVKFERGPDGYALRSLWLDNICDGECDITIDQPIAVLFTRTTLEKHRDRLLPVHLDLIDDGGLIMGIDDEYGWVEVYAAKSSLQAAWRKMARSSHPWKDQRIRTLQARATNACELLRHAIDAWPQFDTDDDVSGADLAEWFALWRRRAKVCLERAGSSPPATPDSTGSTSD